VVSEKIDQHDIINQLKDLAIELQRTPTRIEFHSKTNVTQYGVTKSFGTYSALVIAAGLDPYHPSLKPTNKIFEKPIAQVIEQYEPLAEIAQAVYKPTLVIGDTHFPFVDERVLDKIYEWAERLKPERIIQVGDLYDMYGASKFPKSLNIYKPQEEEELGRQGAEKMWATLRSIAPKAECVQLKGNHDVRPIKRTMEVDPRSEHIVAKHINGLMTFDGVKLIEDSRQEFIVDGIQFIHGYRSKIGEHRDYTLMHTVCGHSHTGGVVYKRIRGQTLWELNAGYCGDAESKALGYTPQKITHWTPGFGWIDEAGPRFVSL
jgi:hypothetical protein